MNIIKSIGTLVCALSGLLLAQNAPLPTAETPEEPDPLNAVVKIHCRSFVPNFAMPWMDRGQNEVFGSGVVIRDKQILTNAHVLTHATYITVSKQSSDEPFEAHVKAVDHDCDLALLEIKAPDFFDDIVPYDIGETPPTQTTVYVAGYPIGGDGLSITQGVISRIELQPYTHSLGNHLAAQLDAAINPGNSGGPVICQGDIVGIAFQIDKQGEGLGYMIPTEIIKHFLKDLEDGHVDGFGQFGFRHSLLENADMREYLKMRKKQTGVRVIHVEKINQDYLRPDDVILSMDDIPITNNGNIRLKTGETRSFKTIHDQKQIGESTTLKLLRNGQEISVSLPVQKIGYRCDGYLHDKLPNYYIIGGFVFTPLSFSLIEEWGDNIPTQLMTSTIAQFKEEADDEIIVLTTVLADRINVGYQNFRSELLTKVNGKPIRNLKSLIDIVENSTDEFITFHLGENEEEVPVTLKLKKLREQSPKILEHYRIPADRSKALRK